MFVAQRDEHAFPSQVFRKQYCHMSHGDDNPLGKEALLDTLEIPQRSGFVLCL